MQRHPLRRGFPDPYHGGQSIDSSRQERSPYPSQRSRRRMTQTMGTCARRIPSGFHGSTRMFEQNMEARAGNSSSAAPSQTTSNDLFKDRGMVWGSASIVVGSLASASAGDTASSPTKTRRSSANGARPMRRRAAPESSRTHAENRQRGRKRAFNGERRDRARENARESLADLRRETHVERNRLSCTHVQVHRERSIPAFADLDLVHSFGQVHDHALARLRGSPQLAVDDDVHIVGLSLDRDRPECRPRGQTAVTRA